MQTSNEGHSIVYNQLPSNIPKSPDHKTGADRETVRLQAIQAIKEPRQLNSNMGSKIRSSEEDDNGDDEMHLRCTV